jgi:uncharacterized protein (DUF433 family)
MRLLIRPRPVIIVGDDFEDGFDSDRRILVAFAAQPLAPPLREEADGALRIGSSRVLLELVIRAFQDGATPEAIVHRYSTLELRDVYAVIAYYLNHRKDIEHYLSSREQKADEVRQRIEARQGDFSDIRARLLARRQARE